MTQFTFDPNVVPEKFKDSAGNVNVQALAQSAAHLGMDLSAFAGAGGQIDVGKLSIAYREKEAAQGTGVVAPGTPGATQVAPAPAAGVINTEEPDNASQVDWSQIQLDAQGNVPPAQRQMLIKAGFPQDMIDRFERGERAEQELNTHRAAAALPGGMDTYNKVIAWANTALPIEERRRMAGAMAGPAGDMALLGYYQQYIAANPTANVQGGGEPNLGGINTMGGGAGGGDVAITDRPFETRDERRAAFSSKRYELDAVYRDEVQARMRATSAAVVEAQKLNPSRGWRPPTRRNFD